MTEDDWAAGYPGPHDMEIAQRDQEVAEAYRRANEVDEQKDVKGTNIRKPHRVVSEDPVMIKGRDIHRRIEREVRQATKDDLELRDKLFSDSPECLKRKINSLLWENLPGNCTMAEAEDAAFEVYRVIAELWDKYL